MAIKYETLHSFFELNRGKRPNVGISSEERDSFLQYSFDSFLLLIEDAEKTIKNSHAGTIAICLSSSFAVAVNSLAASMAGVRSVLIPSSSSVEEIIFAIQKTKAEKILCDDDEFEEEESQRIKGALSPLSSRNEKEEGTFIFFTSGTSSTPKAVELSSKALLDSAYNGQCKLPCGADDRIISILPMEHVFGFVCGFLWPLVYGAELFFGGGVKSMKTDLSFFRPTIIPLVPILASLLLSTKSIPSSTRYILVGAGPLGASSIAAIKAMGVKLAFGYGLTETASGVAIAVDKENPLLMEPCPEDTFRVEKDGTLSIKSGSMMNGYYLDEKATKKALGNDGYFHTSDLAKIDEEGRIMILGRIDDIIALGNGEKVNASSIEASFAPVLKGLDFAIGSHHGSLALYYFSRSEASLGLFQKAIEEYNKKAGVSLQISDYVSSSRPLPRTRTGKIERYLLKE